jgi:hypothetical protein
MQLKVLKKMHGFLNCTLIMYHKKLFAYPAMESHRPFQCSWICNVRLWRTKEVPKGSATNKWIENCNSDEGADRNWSHQIELKNAKQGEHNRHFSIMSSPSVVGDNPWHGVRQQGGHRMVTLSSAGSSISKNGRQPPKNVRTVIKL